MNAGLTMLGSTNIIAGNISAPKHLARALVKPKRAPPQLNPKSITHTRTWLGVSVFTDDWL
ncbi:MAG: hypothetical protein ABJ360_13015, partial [Roseobacter sp.]